MDLCQPSPSYYSILGVDKSSSASQIRSAYRKLAMQWHPDRWTRTPSVLGKAKRKFQQIQEAYSVLSDPRKRTLYDAGLYNALEEDEEEVEGFSDFLQEMLSLMDNVRREEKNCGMEELQSMFLEMAQGFGFDSPQLFCGHTRVDDYSSRPKRGRWEPNPTVESESRLHLSGLQMFGSTGFCT